MGLPEEDRAVEQEKKLQFDDMNEALVYIAEKMGAIEEIGKATQQEIVLLRKDFLKFTKYIIMPLFIFALMALATCVAALLTSEMRVPSVGTVKTVGVGAFWDINCASVVTEIDWGLVEPGYQVNTTIYLRNEGNAPITLSLGTENWSPSNASDYITLSWDYADQTVDPGAVVKVNLTLAVSSDITGITNFTFDIIITGIG